MIQQTADTDQSETYRCIEPLEGARPETVTYIEDGVEVTFSDLQSVETRTAGPNILVYAEQTEVPIDD